MKKTILLSLILCSGMMVLSQSDSNKIGPQLTFLNIEINYDTIERYSNGTRTFVFYNTGDEPLIIKKVKSGCSCTISSYTQDTIYPGGKGEINAGYNTRKPGKFDRKLTVHSNASNGKKRKIRIVGFVLDPKKYYGIESTK